jgi:hypothetical protein
VYLDAVRQALGPAAAERFLAEVRDHLLESVAAGVDQGLAPADAEARAIELFGSPQHVARHYAAELAEALEAQGVLTRRVIAATFALLTLYYARFFIAVRQEAPTLVQIGILLAAVAVLTLPTRLAPRGAAWFRGWRPAAMAGWLTALVALGLAVTAFAWADHDSHSVSDTLNRSVPTLCLILAITLRLAHQSNRAPTATLR